MSYRAVQAAGKALPGMKRTKIVGGYRTRAIGADLTYVKCKGKWLALGVIVDPINGMVLSIDHLSGEDAQALQAWIEPIADYVGAHTLVSDDTDASSKPPIKVGWISKSVKAMWSAIPRN